MTVKHPDTDYAGDKSGFLVDERNLQGFMAVLELVHQFLGDGRGISVGKSVALNGSLSREFPYLLKPNLAVAELKTVLPSDLGVSRDIFKNVNNRRGLL